MSGYTDISKAVFGYEPNTAAAIVVGIIYLALFFALSFRLYRSKSWWGLCLPIGVLGFSVGFFLRKVSVDNPSSIGIFAISQFFIVVLPATFLAFNYIVYGRMMRASVGDRPGYSLIRPNLVSKIFVTSDVVTFIVQGSAAGLSANSSSGLASLSKTLLKIGLILQLISYILFIIIVIYSHYRLHKDPNYGLEFPWILIYVLYFSSVFIVVRGAYRIAEQVDNGGQGFLISHEIFFYMLDTFPLFLATAIYVPFWPGNLLKQDRGDYSTVLAPLGHNKGP